MAKNKDYIKFNNSLEDNNQIILSDYFPKAIFWDVNLDELDYKKDADFIIPRVLDWGDYKNAWDKLKLLYPLKVIKYYCLNQAQIFGDENIEALAAKFNLNPEEFPRYSK
ncbi:DUF6922 domain-containing protein [Belliella pelovolcani]|uniref:DUF6922 domain-containing protein n=1 Tax=Belliella pelovolcani TaxID=529505 RepID=A0A1N7Q5J5_9BACT|nr:hypothetical protein [Belliella pelovolcani]SIT18138.1 hypothetical protein SAMN05421761_1334 [Belliella pelovolcani]